MEHRFHPHAAVEAEAIVIHRGAPVAICLTRDLSLGGAFIRTGPLNFPRNTPLELDLALRTGEVIERHRVSALVVHSGAGGTGLLFLNTNAAARAAIRNAQHLAATAGQGSSWTRGDNLQPPILLMGN